MRLTTQMRYIVLVLFGFSLVNITALFLQINRMNGNARVINLTGVIRGSSQKITKLRLNGERDQFYINTIDQIFSGLVGGSSELGLTAIKNPELLGHIQTLQSRWNTLKNLIDSPENDPQHQEDLIRLSEEVWRLADSATESAEKIADQNLNILQGLKISLFVLNLLLLGIIASLIQSISNKLDGTVKNVVLSTKEIASIVEEQERVTIQQQTVINETTNVITELREFSEDVAQQAGATKKVADQVMDLTTEGSQTVKTSQQDMTELKKQVDNISQHIAWLQEKANQVGTISQAVRDLADQTNMLALNAAIESVRAGEQGEGFRVVAREIRQLADKSKQSAQNINSLILDIQNRIKNTVVATKMGTESLNQTVQTTKKTVTVFHEVAQVINQVAISSEQILLSTKQQVHATQQVVDTMHHLENAAEETKLGMNYARSSAQRLNLAAETLNEIT
ncbi:methyl-accepting chemotaxis protein [Spirulina subsalsa]|uniref:methyl-accepting chemotaxis protein n=1 Tax=Spirulina subsalsa TaxID=54311 RepID=UPI000306E7D1|nr:methyl-accepting chemotaxis protein [Spirulina subsalsa]